MSGPASPFIGCMRPLHPERSTETILRGSPIPLFRWPASGEDLVIGLVGGFLLPADSFRISKSWLPGWWALSEFERRGRQERLHSSDLTRSLSGEGYTVADRHKAWRDPFVSTDLLV